ncbi:MAG: acetyltransferase [Deltaproteobacteria bacterium]|jgi:N-hydroxyarylamine O-acetyltransferase|nr:acetyltransferase [Deltaproteobacteria bacterium]
MDLDAYLERIGFRAAVRPDEDTLFGLHAAHLAAIPYENLDLQLGQEKHLDETAFFERLVDERRGGWCYEMNGLFSRALREIGFTVEYVGGAVARDILGDAAIGNHMVLLVELGRAFVADVGLGDGPTHPFPLEARSWSEAGFVYALERCDEGWWRFHNHRHGMAANFEFTETPRGLEWYREQNTLLQTVDRSPFVGWAIVIHRGPERVRALRDTTYLEIDGQAKHERSIDSGEQYAALLHQLLGRDLGSDAPRLWQKVAARAADRAAAADEA